MKDLIGALKQGEFEAWFLASDGYRLHRVGFCRDCGAPLWFWKCVDPSRSQYKVRPKQGRVYPFDFRETRPHQKTCAVRPDKAESRSGFATRRADGQGESQAGSGRDEPVVRMEVGQAGEQVTRRAEPLPTPPLSASRLVH